MQAADSNKGIKSNQYWEDMASILSNMKRFKKAVIDARIKWKIPITGLPWDKRGNWYSSLFVNPDNTDKNYYTSGQDQLIPPSEVIRSTLKEISEQFNLDNRWHSSLLLHIASDDVPLTAPFGSPSLEIRINDSRLPEKEWIIKRMWIEIYPDTSLKDIQTLWKRIETYQSMMSTQYPKKRRPLENVKKYIKVRELEDNNTTHKKIANDYPELGFGTYKDVADFKNRIEERFSPKRVRK